MTIDLDMLHGALAAVVGAITAITVMFFVRNRDPESAGDIDDDPVL